MESRQMEPLMRRCAGMVTLMILCGMPLGGCGAIPARQDGERVALARELMVESAKLMRQQVDGQQVDGQQADGHADGMRQGDGSVDTKTARSEAAERAVRIWRGSDGASDD